MREERRVVVVTGVGGMGVAVARRLGSGATVVLADVNSDGLAAVASALRSDGYQVVEQITDVSDAQSVGVLAKMAGDLGRVEAVVHTAGLSPVQAQVPAILAVDLLGTALMLDAFSGCIASGGAGVFVASMAGTMFPMDPPLEHLLATTPTGSLLDLPALAAIADPGTAYGMAKRANQVRVRAASAAWGRRGARVNSISPGIISTPMGAAELAGPHGEAMRAMLAASPAGRVGTAEDIASAVAFLIGPMSSFITGTDLLVDGGVVASLNTASGPV